MANSPSAPSIQKHASPYFQLIVGFSLASTMNMISILLLLFLAYLVTSQGPAMSNWHLVLISGIHAGIVLTIAALVFRYSKKTAPYFAWAWLLSVGAELSFILFGWTIFFIDGGLKGST